LRLTRSAALRHHQRALCRAALHDQNHSARVPPQQAIAIGKRHGAWGLKEDAAEANRGFLLNHAIGDLLPPDLNGKRYSNSDPVTGQAAWFDLRVRVRKCSAQERDFTEPRFDRLRLPPGLVEPPPRLSFGADFRHRKECAP
jgi:hypothetical protein